LQDIGEAKKYCIHLNDLTLNELYSYLKDARRQRNEFERSHPSKTFQYDPKEDQQFQYNDDGLDELKEMFIKEHSAKDKSLPRRKVSTPERVSVSSRRNRSAEGPRAPQGRTPGGSEANLIPGMRHSRFV
jgi:hypothetical protein